MRPLKVLFAVQRYGADFSGGAEALTRTVAEGLAGRGHAIEVATTCAKSYVDWANHYDEGVELLNGVTIRRFRVDRRRDNHLFASLNSRVAIPRHDPPPLFLQRTWQQLQGPESAQLLEFLDTDSDRFDVVAFFTYLYWSSTAGVPIAAAHAPTILQTLAHDEPPFHLPVQDEHLLAADRILCCVPEEADLIRRRLGDAVPVGLAGPGTDMDLAGDGDRFRETHGLGDRPYLLYVGRLDPSKGVKELFEMFRTYKERNADDLALVLLGEKMVDLGSHPDIIQTGFVEEHVRGDAIAGCTMLVNPSYFESFSMVLTEAWAFRKPVLVNGRCRVLAEQVRRSRGGVAYDGFAEFETAVVDMVWDEPVLLALGTWGHDYTVRNYTWDTVLDRYEAHLHLTATRSGVRVPR